MTYKAQKTALNAKHAFQWTCCGSRPNLNLEANNLIRAPKKYRPEGGKDSG